MCTRFVYNGIDKIVGFNFDIDLSVWDHTVITEENRFYIGIKMPDGMYHSFHGINKNGNVGTLLYVHGNENARYIESEDCITISELTEKFIKAEISFDKALDIVKKKKIIYAPDATMQAMLSDKKGRVLIIEPGIGYRYEQENFSLITNYSILKPDITKPYIVSGDTRYEVAKELLAGYDKDFSVNKKDYIKRRCTDEREVRELFEDYLGFLSSEENDNWKRVLCEYIQKESSKKAREMLLKYCNVSNRWASFKDGVRIPEYRQSLDNYLENTISNGEERNIYFISDEKFDQKIVCITNKISRVLLKDESNLSVFVPEIINLSDCMDADFYIFDSQGCTGIRYKCIGCEHGVIVLKKDAQRTSEVG